MVGMTIELDEREIAEACRSHLLRVHGLEVVGAIVFTVTAATDMMDRPTGGQALGARATARRSQHDGLKD